MAKSKRDQAQAFTLTVADKALDFGEVWEDAAFLWELPVENRSPSDLRVIELVSSCGCLAVEPPSLEVPAGETRSLRLSLDLTYSPRAENATPGKTAQTSTTSRPFSVKVGAKMQGPDGGTLPNVVWTVRGRVRPVLTVDPRAVGFGDSLVRGQPSPTRTVNVTAHIPLKRLDVACEPDRASAQLSRLLDDSSTYELVIRPRSDLKQGTVNFNVVLRPTAKEGALPQVVISVQGSVLEDIQATPAILSFGSFALGKSVSEVIALRSCRGEPFEVERIECQVPGATVATVTSEPGVKEYRVTQRITQEGNQSGLVRFHVKASKGSTLIVPVRLNYLGLAE
jgi:hypothetical protein